MTQVPFIQRVTCTVPEATAHTGLARSTLFDMMAKNEIERVKLGTRTFIKVESLLRLLDVAKAS